MKYPNWSKFGAEKSDKKLTDPSPLIERLFFSSTADQIFS